MFLQEKLSAIKVNLRLLLTRVEELKVEKPDYEVNAELKIDELNDIISKLEVIVND
jgi:hypothetical protein